MGMRKLHDWLTLADYEAAKEEGISQVVARYSRGNVSVQNGWYLDDAALARLSVKADRATDKLKEKADKVKAQK